jgi:hypothetical protein
LLIASTDRLSVYEAAVASAQERLRKELATGQKLRELIALYEPDEALETATQLNFPENVVTLPGAIRDAAPQKEAVPRQPKTPATPGRETKKDRMTRVISALLSQRGSVHRNDLLAYLQGADLMGHETKPMAHLAAFLSNNRDIFMSDGRGNFSLRPNGTQSAGRAPDGLPIKPEDISGADEAVAP